MAGGKIFINYRREDSAGYARSLYDRLNGRFRNQVFMDVSVLEPGTDFVEAIEAAVGSCDALIVLIGKEWLTITANGRRRLDDPGDFVRLEVAAALKRNVRVIPALVGGAAMPSADQLPEDLQPLARRQALQVTDQDWDHDLDRLVTALERALEPASPPTPTPIPQPARDPRSEAREAMNRREWAAAAKALRECLSMNPSDGAAAADLRWVLEQSRAAAPEPGPASAANPTPHTQFAPTVAPPGPVPAPVPFLSPSQICGRWQLKETQAILQVTGFMDLYPNLQFQVLVQGMVALAGYWNYNTLTNSLEVQGQNLMGVGFRGALRLHAAAGYTFSGRCFDVIGNSWIWELTR